MKKLLGFVGALCLFMGTAHAACVITSCGGRGNDCINAYSLEVKPEGRVAKNEVYICGKNHCQNGTIIHDYALDKFYMCVIASDAGVNFMWMGDDTWEEYPVSTCSDPSDGYILSADPNATKALRNSTDRTETLRKNDTGSVVLQAGSNICIEYKCNPGYGPNEKADKCIPKVSSGSDDTKKGNPTGGGKASSSCTDRCRGMSGVQYTECVTCCKVSEDYADWNGSECVCADKTLDFNVLTQKCEAPSETTITLPEVVVTPECPDTQVTILNQWLIQYAGNSDVISRVQVLLDYCNGAVINITSFNQMFTELQNFIDGLATSAEQDASRRRIEEAVSAINSRIGDLDVSVWRNAEGEFNTSRLLSDSIAGVVLGTAGGLITSHVVKKNNIASGFEDIKCAIGGQVVADWGDQFQVGIQ